MKHFVSKSILFVLLFLIYILANYLVNLYHIRSDIPELKLDNCKILIAGDSHPETSLNPRFFDSANNISQSAEPYFVTYWKLKKLLTKKNAIDIVLLGFSFHNISAFNDRKLNDSKWSSEIFKRIYPIEELETLKDIEIDWQGYYKILIRKMCLYPVKNHINYIGKYKKLQKSYISDYNISIKRHYYYNNKNVGISAVAINFLKLIINLCEENQIKIILVTTPLHKEYLERIPSNFKQKFLQLKNELTNGGIVVLDYSRSAFNDRNFMNSDHLNETGAKRFTKMIIDRLQHL